MTETSSLTPLVELHALSKAFDGKTIIADLELAINHGEFLTILGPSGCGKTTVLRLIAGLEDADRGRIVLDGGTSPPFRPNIATSTPCFRAMPCFRTCRCSTTSPLACACKGAGGGTDAARRRGAAHGAAGCVRQAAAGPALGGQQQRVAIARAVVNKPKVLLLDESLSALDYKLRKQMQNELKALQRKLGITFVFVTHDQEEALTMSDRIVVMREGRIEQDGTPREIYEEPKNLFVASFIGEINIFDAVVLQRLDPQRVRANVEGRECDIYADLPVEPGQKLKVLLRRRICG